MRLKLFKEAQCSIFHFCVKNEKIFYFFQKYFLKDIKNIQLSGYNFAGNIKYPMN